MSTQRCRLTRSPRNTNPYATRSSNWLPLFFYAHWKTPQATAKSDSKTLDGSCIRGLKSIEQSVSNGSRSPAFRSTHLNDSEVSTLPRFAHGSTLRQQGEERSLRLSEQRRHAAPSGDGWRRGKSLAHQTRTDGNRLLHAKPMWASEKSL